MYFIHTFSLRKNIANKDMEVLKRQYDNNSLKWISEEKKYMINKYVDNGIRFSFAWRHENDLKRDKANPWKVEMIITPYKLLHKGKAMGMIQDEEEWKDCMNELIDILEDIEDQCGVNLKKRLKLMRIDIAIDIKTPNDEYSREIIKLAKLSDISRGYEFWEPSLWDVIKTGWKKEDSVMIYNHHKDLEGKIYNKAVDLKNRGNGEYLDNDHGLLRLEVTLKKAFLKKNFYLLDECVSKADLEEVLLSVQDDAEELVQKEFLDQMWKGHFFCKHILKTYIEIRERRNPAKRDKMIAYSGFVNERKPDDYGSKKKRKTVDGYFKYEKISPVTTNKDYPYIPSFKDMLKGSYDVRLLEYAKKHTSAPRIFWDGTES